jgi:hypothetical protein
MLLITQRIMRQRTHDDAAEREGLVLAENMFTMSLRKKQTQRRVNINGQWCLNRIR